MTPNPPFADRTGAPPDGAPRLALMQDTTIKPTPDADAGSGFDWTQWICPGPRRVFTPEELERGGYQPWSKAIDGYVWSNAIVVLAINYATFAKQLAVGICAVILITVWLALAVSRRLWQRPTRRNLNLATWGAAVYLIALGLAARFVLHVDRTQLEVPLLIMVALLVGAVTAWWFLTVYRVQQIEGRLRELADQAAALRLTRRLATAQIQPHFLFNTLASVQHWVDTQDQRAGPTLRSFTQYLRATLPMFEREQLSLADELQIVRSYLEVMQARLGARLAWSIDVEPALHDVIVPPGALLTLAENAIAHGIEPSLRGGTVTVRGRREADAAIVEVIDDGVGLCAEPTEGVGLRNTRARLLQLHGLTADLRLRGGGGGGCIARLRLPLATAAH